MERVCSVWGILVSVGQSLNPFASHHLHTSHQVALPVHRRRRVISRHPKWRTSLHPPSQNQRSMESYPQKTSKPRFKENQTKNSTISWAMAWGQNNPRKPCLIPLASKQLSGSLAFELDSMSREPALGWWTAMSPRRYQFLPLPSPPPPPPSAPPTPLPSSSALLLSVLSHFVSSPCPSIPLIFFLLLPDPSLPSPAFPPTSLQHSSLQP